MFELKEQTDTKIHSNSNNDDIHKHYINKTQLFGIYSDTRRYNILHTIAIAYIIQLDGIKKSRERCHKNTNCIITVLIIKLYY